MPSPFQNTLRRVVPRWHSFAHALRTKELDPITIANAPVADAQTFLKAKEVEWLDSKNLFSSLDLLNAVNVLGPSSYANEAAEFILRNPARVTPIARKLAEQTLGIYRVALPVAAISSHDLGLTRSNPQIVHAKARRLREPRNAFAWAELARLYALNGLTEQAKRPMQIALGLAPNDRFILRCATRFLLHINKADEALAMLRRSKSIASDPWILAAEIAVSSILEKHPSHIKQARAVCDDKNINPLYVSELEAAIASLEMWSGNSKRAKAIFFTALKHPTENALAQAVWAADNVGLGAYPFERVIVEGAFEAQALDAQNKAEWKNSIMYCSEWEKTESFSSRPYGLSSSITSSLLRLPVNAEATARRGLLTNPRHPGLVNNIAFALVEQGKPENAELELENIDLRQANDQTKVSLIATAGLVNYRLGRTKKGKEYYTKSIFLAERSGLSVHKAIAQLYLAREEARIGSSGFGELFDVAADRLKALGDPFGNELVVVLGSEIKELVDKGASKRE